MGVIVPPRIDMFPVFTYKESINSIVEEGMLILRLLSEGAEGPNTDLVWLLYIGMGFLFLAILSGWWDAVRKQKQEEVRQEAEKPKKRKAVKKSGK